MFQLLRLQAVATGQNDQAFTLKISEEFKFVLAIIAVKTVPENIGVILLVRSKSQGNDRIELCKEIFAILRQCGAIEKSDCPGVS